eukprot:gnl/TRDRNA2_/TRDRNA2_134384_c0_seq2.p1 gnl/TRDRNA2_/TRDRNA2_134384_c0~~gnl/TRDRNA2_/TRDRNA2_134384_c0_seq2.p1  ORF type:complete len:838 (+),score=154.80 gnl/TRDRNA2_/TRDRNA2_134384_c0_seq2:58-2514(+)
MPSDRWEEDGWVDSRSGWQDDRSRDDQWHDSRWRDSDQSSWSALRDNAREERAQAARGAARGTEGERWQDVKNDYQASRAAASQEEEWWQAGSHDGEQAQRSHKEEHTQWRDDPSQRQHVDGQERNGTSSRPDASANLAKEADPWQQEDPWGKSAANSAAHSSSADRWASNSWDRGASSAPSGGGSDTRAVERTPAATSADSRTSWTSQSPAATQGSSVPAARQGSWGDAKPAAGEWQGSQPRTNVGDSTRDPTLLNESQKESRWREYRAWQTWNLQQRILPGKGQEDDAAEYRRLWPEEGEGTRGAGIDFHLYDQVRCKLSGPKCELIPAFDTFAEIFQEFRDCMPPQLAENIRSCKYERPTPVQKFAIPAALTGRDVMCCAQTGSGKTAAFLVPVLASMIKNHRGVGALTEPFQGPCQPDTLIISPTRELCLQTYDEALKFCYKTQYRVVRIYGQEPVKTQVAELAKGADVVVATPGRLWDFVSSGICEVTKVNCLVLDEADRMLEMNMKDWIRDVILEFGMPETKDRQTMMFSATFPEDIQKMATDYLYQHIWVGVGVVGGPTNTVTQRFMKMTNDEKFDQLLDLLYEFLDRKETGDRLIVFTNSKLKAKGLDEMLYDKKVDTGALHGDLTQIEREENLRKFRNGQIDVLVATDVASRGLDIDGVKFVVNYDTPFSIQIYVQRIGRTGRIGNRGEAITFIEVDKDGTFLDREEVLQQLPQIIGQVGGEVPDWLQKHVDGLNEDKWAGGTNEWEDSAARNDVREPEGRWESWTNVAEVSGANAPEVTTSRQDGDWGNWSDSKQPSPQADAWGSAWN